MKHPPQQLADDRGARRRRALPARRAASARRPGRRGLPPGHGGRGGAGDRRHHRRWRCAGSRASQADGACAGTRRAADRAAGPGLVPGPPRPARGAARRARRGSPTPHLRRSSLVSVLAGWAFARGAIFLAGWLTILAGTLDILDGGVARRTGRREPTRRASSTRWSIAGRKVATFLGLGIWFLHDRMDARAWRVAAFALADGELRPRARRGARPRAVVGPGAATRALRDPRRRSLAVRPGRRTCSVRCSATGRSKSSSS